MAAATRATALPPSKAGAPNTPQSATIPSTAAPPTFTSKVVQRVQNMTVSFISTLIPPELHQHLGQRIRQHTRQPLTLPTRQSLCNAILTAIRKYPRTTIIIVLGLAAEYQQPGFLPRPKELSAFLVTVPWVALLMCVCAALGEWADAGTWQGMWDREVVKYWGDESVLGESTMMENTVTGSSPAALEKSAETPTLGFMSGGLAQSTTPTNSPLQRGGESDTRTSSPTSFGSSLSQPSSVRSPSLSPHSATVSPPPQSTSAPMPITTLAPHLVLPPPTPSQIHKSGLLGESPMPVAKKFSSTNFAGEGFAIHNRALRRVGRWSGHERGPMSEWLEGKRSE